MKTIPDSLYNQMASIVKVLATCRNKESPKFQDAIRRATVIHKRFEKDNCKKRDK